MKNVNNYRFQQQQQNREKYKKVKEIKEKFKKTPLDVSEELNYIKRLLNGENVGNFKSEEDVKNVVENSWVDAKLNLDLEKLIAEAQKMTLSQFLTGTSGYKRRRL